MFQTGITNCFCYWLKKYIYSTFYLLNSIHLDFVILTPLTHPRQILVVVLQTARRWNGKTKDLSATLGLNCWSHLWEVSRRWWIKYTQLMWLWGGCLHKIPSLGSILYGTKRLLWRSHRQSPTLHSKCGINQGLTKRGSTVDHYISRC
jgi:hypothetical protein